MGSWTVIIWEQMRLKCGDRSPVPDHFRHLRFLEMVTIISHKVDSTKHPKRTFRELNHTHTSIDQLSLLIMAFMVVSTEEWWRKRAALTIIQLSAHSLPCRGWSWSAVGCWCLARWHRLDRVSCKPMEDNNSIGVWQIRVKSNSPDFHFDSDRLMSWSWMPLCPTRVMDLTFYSTRSF